MWQFSSCVPQLHSLNSDMSTPRITLCVQLQLLLLDPYLFFALIFTCWNSNAPFTIVMLVRHVSNSNLSVVCMTFYDVLCFLSSCFFTLQILYFSSPPNLSCVAQSLLVPGKIPSKYGRRGSAIGIGTIEEVDIYPFHITNVIFTAVIWYGVAIILPHLFIVVGVSLSICSFFSYLYKERIINSKINNRRLEKFGRGYKIDSYTSLCWLA